MQKYFITGLVILLPLTLTIAVVAFVFNLLTDPFVGISKQLLSHFDLLGSDLWFLSADQVQKYASKLLIALSLFSFTLLLGAVARMFFFSYLIRTWDFVLHRIPFVRSIYKTSQEVIKTIFNTDTRSFKQVVIVPFPTKETQAIGFITRENMPSFTKAAEGTSFVAVFVPTAPNPTSGFLMTYRQQDLTYLDMKVEDAFKFIVSCGVIMPQFQSIEQNIEAQIEEALVS